jgi:hypothetical protein
VASEVALPSAARLRAALRALAIAALALALCTALGLLVVAGPFHTPLGSLA